MRSVPRASAGFRRLAASPVPAAPPGADQGVRLVDEQDDRLRRALDLLDHLLQALLELALHRGPGLQRPTSRASRRRPSASAARRPARCAARSPRPRPSCRRRPRRRGSDCSGGAASGCRSPAGSRRRGRAPGRSCRRVPARSGRREALERLRPCPRRRRQARRHARGADRRRGLDAASPSGEPATSCARSRPQPVRLELRNCSEIASSRRLSSVSSSMPCSRWPVRIRPAPNIRLALIQPRSITRSICRGEVEHRRAALADPLERPAQSAARRAWSMPKARTIRCRSESGCIRIWFSQWCQLDISVAPRARELNALSQRADTATGRAS